MTRNYIHINLVLLPEQKKTLKLWAKNEDRSVSAVLRRLIDQEVERRETEKQQDSASKFEDL